MSTPTFSPSAAAAASATAPTPALNPNPVEIDPDYEALPPTAGPIAHMIAGALAGITEHTVIPYTSTYQAFSRITSTEGARALWRGVSSVVVGAGPAHALYFATYEQCKAVAMRLSKAEDERNIAPMWAAAAGATATVVQDAIMNPFDVIKQRMQAYSGSQYSSLAHCARSVLKNEGVRAFYISYPTTLSMSIPFQSVHFAVYEAVSASLNPSRNYDPKSHIVAGAMAGALASAVTTPLDVAKTLLQTKGEVTDVEIRQARGMRDAMRLVWQREGASGFWKGLTPRVLSHMPATAVCWTTYEFFKSFLGDREQAARDAKEMSKSA
ncbi:mitochondrial carrier domain-containing protein [Catenaria anguillulae PL171]|uniref:Mitochondrial carrier domain-containing protein n=1 Tax=Catenaria anguillulae PL171 TaxID=765915 RepID=A0A1Y2HPR8_9FUNG|nr:mitochondrial carrier domain-containing protein [Catenaria anguillulae PL171]